MTLRARTWHGAAVSEWSAPAIFLVADKAIGPTINGALVGPSQQYVNLAGPAAPQRFEATAGDHVVLHGFFPTSDTAEIPVVLRQGERSVRIATKRLDAYKVDLFISDRLRGGPWAITIGTSKGMPPLSLATSMSVHDPTTVAPSK
jgi:hypothetical protein